MPDTSTVAVFNAVGQPLGLKQIALPQLASGEVLVRVTCCTLCGSDLHTYEGRRSSPTPVVLGHEMLGTVAALGPGEPPRDYAGIPLSLAARVTWSLAASCGACFYCQRDLRPKCEQLFKYGHQMLDERHALSGGLAEYCHLARGTAIVRLPDDLDDRVACPANCATATVMAALRAAGGCADEVVLVQGVGMLGATACAVAAQRGAREVIACDVDAARLECAARFGATRCIRMAGDIQALTDAVHSATEGRGADVALELSGATSAMQAGIPLLRTGGRYILVGAVTPGPSLTVNAEQIVRRWLTIRGVHNYAPDDLGQAIEFLAANQHRYPFSELVSRTFPLAQAEQAFQHAISSRAFRVAVLP